MDQYNFEDDLDSDSFENDMAQPAELGIELRDLEERWINLEPEHWMGDNEDNIFNLLAQGGGDAWNRLVQHLDRPMEQGMMLAEERNAQIEYATLIAANTLSFLEEDVEDRYATIGYIRKNGTIIRVGNIASNSVIYHTKYVSTKPEDYNFIASLIGREYRRGEQLREEQNHMNTIINELSFIGTLYLLYEALVEQGRLGGNLKWWSVALANHAGDLVRWAPLYFILTDRALGIWAIEQAQDFMGVEGADFWSRIVQRAHQFSLTMARTHFLQEQDDNNEDNNELELLEDQWDDDQLPAITVNPGRPPALHDQAQVNLMNRNREVPYLREEQLEAIRNRRREAAENALRNPIVLLEVNYLDWSPYKMFSFLISGQLEDPDRIRQSWEERHYPEGTETYHFETWVNNCPRLLVPRAWQNTLRRLADFRGKDNWPQLVDLTLRRLDNGQSPDVIIQFLMDTEITNILFTKDIINIKAAAAKVRTRGEMDQVSPRRYVILGRENRYAHIPWMARLPGVNRILPLKYIRNSNILPEEMYHEVVPEQQQVQDYSLESYFYACLGPLATGMQVNPGPTVHMTSIEFDNWIGEQIESRYRQVRLRVLHTMQAIVVHLPTIPGVDIEPTWELQETINEVVAITETHWEPIPLGGIIGDVPPGEKQIIDYSEIPSYDLPEIPTIQILASSMFGEYNALGNDANGNGNNNNNNNDANNQQDQEVRDLIEDRRLPKNESLTEAINNMDRWVWPDLEGLEEHRLVGGRIKGIPCIRYSNLHDRRQLEIPQKLIKQSNLIAHNILYMFEPNMDYENKVLRLSLDILEKLHILCGYCIGGLRLGIDPARGSRMAYLHLYVEALIASRLPCVIENLGLNRDADLLIQTPTGTVYADVYTGTLNSTLLTKPDKSMFPTESWTLHVDMSDWDVIFVKTAINSNHWRDIENTQAVAEHVATLSAEEAKSLLASLPVNRLCEQGNNYPGLWDRQVLDDEVVEAATFDQIEQDAILSCTHRDGQNDLTPLYNLIADHLNPKAEEYPPIPVPNSRPMPNDDDPQDLARSKNLRGTIKMAKELLRGRELRLDASPFEQCLWAMIKLWKYNRQEGYSFNTTKIKQTVGYFRIVVSPEGGADLLIEKNYNDNTVGAVVFAPIWQKTHERPFDLAENLDWDHVKEITEKHVAVWNCFIAFTPGTWAYGWDHVTRYWPQDGDYVGIRPNDINQLADIAHRRRSEYAAKLDQVYEVIEKPTAQGTIDQSAPTSFKLRGWDYMCAYKNENSAMSMLNYTVHSRVEKKATFLSGVHDFTIGRETSYAKGFFMVTTSWKMKVLYFHHMTKNIGKFAHHYFTIGQFRHCDEMQLQGCHWACNNDLITTVTPLKVWRGEDGQHFRRLAKMYEPIEGYIKGYKLNCSPGYFLTAAIPNHQPYTMWTGMSKYLMQFFLAKIVSVKKFLSKLPMIVFKEKAAKDLIFCMARQIILAVGCQSNGVIKIGTRIKYPQLFRSPYWGYQGISVHDFYAEALKIAFTKDQLNTYIAEVECWDGLLEIASFYKPDFNNIQRTADLDYIPQTLSPVGHVLLSRYAKNKLQDWFARQLVIEEGYAHPATYETFQMSPADRWMEGRPSAFLIALLAIRASLHKSVHYEDVGTQASVAVDTKVDYILSPNAGYCYWNERRSSNAVALAVHLAVLAKTRLGTLLPDAFAVSTFQLGAISTRWSRRCDRRHDFRCMSSSAKMQPMGDRDIMTLTTPMLAMTKSIELIADILAPMTTTNILKDPRKKETITVEMTSFAKRTQGLDRVSMIGDASKWGHAVDNPWVSMVLTVLNPGPGSCLIPGLCHSFMYKQVMAPPQLVKAWESLWKTVDSVIQNRYSLSHYGGGGISEATMRVSRLIGWRRTRDPTNIEGAVPYVEMQNGMMMGLINSGSTEIHVCAPAFAIACLWWNRYHDVNIDRQKRRGPLTTDELDLLTETTSDDTFDVAAGPLCRDYICRLLDGNVLTGIHLNMFKTSFTVCTRGHSFAWEMNSEFLICTDPEAQTFTIMAEDLRMCIAYARPPTGQETGLEISTSALLDQATLVSEGGSVHILYSHYEAYLKNFFLAPNLIERERRPGQGCLHGGQVPYIPSITAKISPQVLMPFLDSLVPGANRVDVIASSLPLMYAALANAAKFELNQNVDYQAFMAIEGMSITQPVHKTVKTRKSSLAQALLDTWQITEDNLAIPAWGASRDAVLSRIIWMVWKVSQTKILETSTVSQLRELLHYHAVTLTLMGGDFSPYEIDTVCNSGSYVRALVQLSHNMGQQGLTRNLLKDVQLALQTAMDVYNEEATILKTLPPALLESTPNFSGYYIIQQRIPTYDSKLMIARFMNIICASEEEVYAVSPTYLYDPNLCNQALADNFLKLRNPRSGHLSSIAKYMIASTYQTIGMIAVRPTCACFVEQGIQPNADDIYSSLTARCYNRITILQNRYRLDTVPLSNEGEIAGPEVVRRLKIERTCLGPDNVTVIFSNQPIVTFVTPPMGFRFPGYKLLLRDKQSLESLVLACRFDSFTRNFNNISITTRIVRKYLKSHPRIFFERINGERCEQYIVSKQVIEEKEVALITHKEFALPRFHDGMIRLNPDNDRQYTSSEVYIDLGDSAPTHQCMPMVLTESKRWVNCPHGKRVLKAIYRLPANINLNVVSSPDGAYVALQLQVPVPTQEEANRYEQVVADRQQDLIPGRVPGIMIRPHVEGNFDQIVANVSQWEQQNILLPVVDLNDALITKSVNLKWLLTDTTGPSVYIGNINTICNPSQQMHMSAVSNNAQGRADYATAQVVRYSSATVTFGFPQDVLHALVRACTRLALNMRMTPDDLAAIWKYQPVAIHYITGNNAMAEYREHRDYYEGLIDLDTDVYRHGGLMPPDLKLNTKWIVDNPGFCGEYIPPRTQYNRVVNTRNKYMAVKASREKQGVRPYYTNITTTYHKFDIREEAGQLQREELARCYGAWVNGLLQPENVVYITFLGAGARPYNLAVNRVTRRYLHEHFEIVNKYIKL